MKGREISGQAQELTDALAEVEPDYILDSLGVEYRKTLGHSGKQLIVKTCPVCGSDSSKVYLNAKTGLGNCFAGSHPPGKNFNKWSFIKASFDSFDEAKKFAYQVASEYGWRPKRKEVEVQLSKDWELPESIARPDRGMMLKYLTDRGIGSDTAKRYHLRWCQYGHFRYQDGKITKYQDYSGRVIIPVFDIEGKLATFQGRDATGSSDRRYLFPPGLPGSGQYLYQAQNALGAKSVVLCEGVFDVIAAQLALESTQATRGVSVIGSFGMHLSQGGQHEALLHLKRSGMEELVFMWDGEAAAQARAVRAALELKRFGIKCRLAILPTGKDPSEASVSEVTKAYFRAAPITIDLAIRLGCGVV